jgi:hypothetical protein
MSQTTAQTTTTSAPNYLGTLYFFKRRPNTILKLIGGLTADNTLTHGGWRPEANYEFATNVDYDLPTPSQPAILEGADAPSAVTYVPSQAKNVVQIFHEAVNISYLKASTGARFSGVQTANVTPEEAARAFQIQRALEKIAQDANYSFLRGTFANPATPSSTALKTRGIITAVTTNVFANAGTPRAVTKAILQNAYKEMIDNAGVQPESLIALCNTDQLGALNTLYSTDFNNGQERTVAGVQVRQVYTAFGVLNLALDLDMPTGQIALVNPNVIQGVHVDVPGKPSGLFYEEIARTGASEKGQIYGQCGIDHGPEWAHGLIKDLS